MNVLVKAKVKPNLQSQSKFAEATQMTGRFNCTAIPHVLIIDPQDAVRWEGFPLLDGYELTPAVVRDILDKYQN